MQLIALVKVSWRSPLVLFVSVHLYSRNGVFFDRAGEAYIRLAPLTVYIRFSFSNLHLLQRNLRVFSILKCTFGEQQDISLQDYTESSLMLQ